MKEEEKLISGVIINFLKENWDKINQEKCKIEESKEKFFELLNTDFQLSMWILMEVCNWGMDKEYLQELFIKQEHYDFRILHIEGKYIKVKYNRSTYIYSVDFVEPKTKTVIYFE